MCVDWVRFTPKRPKEVETTPTFLVLPRYTPHNSTILPIDFARLRPWPTLYARETYCFCFAPQVFEQKPRIFLATTKRDFHAKGITMTSLTRPRNLKQWVAVFQTQARLHWLSSAMRSRVMIDRNFGSHTIMASVSLTGSTFSWKWIFILQNLL